MLMILDSMEDRLSIYHCLYKRVVFDATMTGRVSAIIASACLPINAFTLTSHESEIIS